MLWATRRKLQYISGLLGLLFVILSIILYPIIFKKPTCSDGKKNGDEVGVDCGGSCSLMCKENTSDPLVLWSRGFLVAPHTYNLVALIENQNKNSAIGNINYEFRVYDVNNKMIGRKQGKTFIPPNKQFAIFQPRFDSGEAQVKSVSFEFTDPYVWVKKEATLNTLPIYADSIVISSDVKSPSLTARIKNESIYDIPSFEVIAILYDENHNAINASKTIKDALPSGDSTQVYFTWPGELSSIPVTKDILVSINPFSVSF